MRRVTAGAVCWILSLEFFVGQAIAQAAWRTPYSMSRNAVSDLGSTACGTFSVSGSAYGSLYVCSPLHDVMNVAFFAFGLLGLAGAVLTGPAWPRRRLTTWGLVFLCLFGVGKMTVGLDPENVRPLLHELGALGILCGNVAMLLLGLAVVGRWRRLGVISIVVGVVGIVAFLLMFSGVLLGLGFGGMERVAEYPVGLWMAGVGLLLLVSQRTHRELPAGA